jgi:hypothetical protein
VAVRLMLWLLTTNNPEDGSEVSVPSLASSSYPDLIAMRVLKSRSISTPRCQVSHRGLTSGQGRI